MTIRLKLITTVLLFTCISTPFLILRLDGLKDNFGLAIRIAGIELAAIALVCFISWFFKGRFSKDSAQGVKETDPSFRDRGSLLVVTLTFLAAFIMLATSVLLQKHNSYLDSQLDLQNQQLSLVRREIETQIATNKQANRKRLLDTLYKEQAPDDRALPELYRSVFKESKPRLPKADLRSRQEAVLEFIKLERDSGKIIDLSGAFLNNLDLSKSRLIKHDLEGALQGVDFGAARMAGANFTDTNLQGAIFRGGNLESARFFSSNLTDSDLQATNLEGVIFHESRLSGARLHGAYIKRTIFYGAFLNGAIVRTPQWLKEYKQIAPGLKVFRLDQYKLIEQKDDAGKSIYVFDGQDPVLLAKKPKIE
tara:strand:- start:2710 stop:3804 length:1095 start_codon:yes stop_codon:yes gene_type:complete